MVLENQQLREHLVRAGFREDTSGWLLRGAIRISLPAEGKVSVLLHDPETGHWSVRTEGAPWWVLEGFIDLFDSRPSVIAENQRRKEARLGHS
jgi:hypothetical protein